MIIFDLDGTLADCDHRRHFVDPRKNTDAKFIYDELIDCEEGRELHGNYYSIKTKNRWKPDWKSFYEACDKDIVIDPVRTLWDSYEVEISLKRDNLMIWSGRCESVREKTITWLENNLFGHDRDWWNLKLKMRPIGDSTPDDQLKEKWLDDMLQQNIYDNGCRDIEFVFDDRPKVIRMWRRRGIFVFNCCQHNVEF